MAAYLAKHTTRIYCDRHGWVSGKFGEASKDGLCKMKKYYINYCCGLKCTNEKPQSIFDAIVNDPLSQELMKKAAEDQSLESKVKKDEN